MLNYRIKNLKKILKPTDGELTLLTKDNTINETVVVGGQICNQFSDRCILFTLTINNTDTGDIIYLYKDIKIESSDYLSIGRFSLNKNQSLVASVELYNIEYEGTRYLLSDLSSLVLVDDLKLIIYNDDIGVNITINYFDIIDYEYGFMKIIFLPPLVFNQEIVGLEPYTPQWRIVGEENWNLATTNTDYISLEDGDYSIEFYNIAGYTTPQTINIKIEKMKLTELNVTYEISEAIVNIRCLQIDLVQDFGWRLAGSSSEYYDGDLYVIVMHGTTEVEFKHIDGVTKPENIIFDAELENINFLTVKYTRHVGYVTVYIDPPHIQLGRSHKHNFQWYVIFPDGSNTKLYDSDIRLPLPPTDNSISEQYKLVFTNMIINKRCFETINNNILFTLDSFEEKNISTIISEVEC
jgi:hypothetical protein